jgi:putative membrane protein insertion efficiency factor
MSPEVAVDPRGGQQAPAAAAPAPRRSWAAVAMTRAIRGYQLARSGRPTGCRYLPSCSEYAIEALERHGALRGTALAARRLARCTPWGGHGIDPVPDRRTSCTHP